MSICALLVVKASTIYEIFAALTIALLVGFAFKFAALRQYRKRVLHLENEMLENHSRILNLEQKNAELEREKVKMPEKMAV